MGGQVTPGFQCFSGSISGPFFKKCLGGFGPRSGLRNGFHICLKLCIFGGSMLGAIFLEFLLGLGTPPGRSWAAFWASWDRLGRSQERKNANSPMRKSLFRKSFFFASWSSLWLSSAPLDASWAGLAAQMAPKIFPKATPKLVQKVVQNWTRF